MNIIDLHNHTKFSYDGSNSPEEIIENAIAHSVDLIGISDHQFSLGADLNEYINRISSCKKQFAGKIRVLCGLEIGTRPAPSDFDINDTERLDYVLFESLDRDGAMPLDKFISWQRSFKCPKGLAHTDIFVLGEKWGTDIIELMKSENLFWEINISGNYDYYYDFLTNSHKRSIVSESGITLSVGSDTHWIEEYRFKQLRRANELAYSLGNPIIFDNI